MERPAPVSVTPSVDIQYVLLPIFCALTGYTEKAVRRKIEEGHWREGQHYRKAPDGHILMDLEAFKLWVEGKLP